MSSNLDLQNGNTTFIINNNINNDNTISNNFRRDDSGNDSFRSGDEFPDNERKNKKNINIYRFKFNDSLINDIHNFAKIHEYEERKDFKNSWENWVIENEATISREIQRLKNLGYEGDVVDKMFKSARYYYRKKSTEKKEPNKRRNYIGLEKDLLDSMDNHILNNIKNTDYKPSNGFDNFCKENLDLLKNQVEKLVNFNITDKNEIKNKIKKTYKNRYFMIINK